MLSDFNSPDALAAFWIVEQRGHVGLSTDPAKPSNRAASFTASGKIGDEVGKAHLVHRFEPVGLGARVTMDARVYVPPGGATDSVILMDLECASCGIDTNPGVRLYLRDGRLRVDRSKIGYADPFLPMAHPKIKPGAWRKIGWVVTLGDDASGSSQVYLDGWKVMDAKGVTVLLQEVVDRLAAGITVRSQMDRFQIGITANSNVTGTALMVDDVAFAVT